MSRAVGTGSRSRGRCALPPPVHPQHPKSRLDKAGAEGGPWTLQSCCPIPAGLPIQMEPPVPPNSLAVSVYRGGRHLLPPLNLYVYRPLSQLTIRLSPRHLEDTQQEMDRLARKVEVQALCTEGPWGWVGESTNRGPGSHRVRLEGSRSWKKCPESDQP